MEFEFPTYQINEDMTPVQPRIVISRPLTVDVMIQVDTENLSALGMFTPNFVLTVMKISSSYVIIMIVTLFLKCHVYVLRYHKKKCL